jgi:uncharacterized protein YndB with AHSA1/START domain
MTDSPTTPTATSSRTGTIEREIRIAASPETVFSSWTAPERLARWMGRNVTLEPRVGGAYRIDYNGEDIASGAILELDPPRRLVLSWGWEAGGDPTAPGASRVEVDLEPDGTGTILRLRHSGLVDAAVEGHAVGWDQFLPGLVSAAEAEPAA